MTMDTTVESSRDSKSAPAAPKRSFDIAFLTGNSESSKKELVVDEESKRISPSSPLKLLKKECHDVESEDSERIGLPVDDKLTGNGGSAFRKVSKSANSPSAAGTTAAAATMAAAAAAAASLSEMLPSAYPFSFPAIATTLSLQLLQQNNKNLSMSLFNPMAGHLLPGGSKSYSNLLPPISTGARPSAGTERLGGNLIEDYLRAHASLYQEKDLNGGSLFGHAKSPRVSSSPSSGSEPLSLAMSPPVNTSSYSLPSIQDPRGPVASVSTAVPVITSPIMPPSPVLGPPILPVPAALASLSSPSQNVCAKCNLNFRMTSDLVYHMRSQHRRESDPIRQKRQEKLRCPVCGESFRERHHLTRHMTSHEDREVEAK